MAKYQVNIDYPLDRDGQNWTWEETQMAFALYLLLEPRQINPNFPDIKLLARALHRKPGAVAKKIENIRAFDENRMLQGKKGLSHGSKYDRDIWTSFKQKGDAFVDKALKLLDSTTKGLVLPDGSTVNYDVFVPEGRDRVVQTTTRANQQYFRNTLLANYNERCCLTGVAETKLLVASHIKPWKDADPKTERLAASNGLLLNAFHDKAFDKGLITFDKDLRLIVSPKVKHNAANDIWLFSFEGQEIERPSIMPPDPVFLEYHNDKVFLH